MRPLHEPAFCLLYQEKACGMRELILINDRLRPIEDKITIVQSSHNDTSTNHPSRLMWWLNSFLGIKIRVAGSMFNYSKSV